MDQHFTHLHVHTDFSLLDGAIKVEKLVEYGKKNKFKALAISDHGNIFGAVKFFQKCKSAGIKPILAIEAYLTEDVTIKKIDNKYYHIILIVENETGYKNLCKLISFSFTDGFYFKPRIDYKVLEKYSEGLIVTSGCLGGHIPQLLKVDNYEAIDTQIKWFLRVFGKDRFYLEVQPEDQPEQKVINTKMYALAEKYNLELVATADCHYVDPEDREAHEIMLSIQTQGKLTDPNRYTFGDCRVHLRTTEQMLELFKDHPSAVWNSGKIADRCTFEFKTGQLHFPKCPIPEGFTEDSFFTAQCYKGFEKLLTEEYIPTEKKAEYEARLKLEIDLIIKMGYVGYFLVVSDFIQWAKRNNIPVGPGRGSAAGALVAWALEITGIDPLKYNLLFERFLNPERVSMPDIDIDFCIEGREKVIEYVKDKYGHDKVCQIITFGTMMAKGVLKDVARVLSFPFEDANALTGLIPSQLNITLEEAKEQEPQLKEMIANNPQVAKIFAVAQRLEGLTRHASKHAAGIVISPEPIDEVLPVYIPPKTNDLVTQYAMTELETLGYLKMDFLGLKTLTLIDRVVRMIQENHGITINIEKLPLNDLPTFELLGKGLTSGVFQLESDGLKEVLRKLQPDKFEDIIAVNALYRPGPLGSGMVDDFIERRHGRQKVVYLLPELQPILEETYGVIVYQEQVMKIASVVGGYSLGEADILRRAMGKKKAEVMAEQSKIFVEKATALNFNAKKAQELFDLMAYFAGYGFNKSHSAAYAMIAYQTAYLKAHYPGEFMAVLISLESDNAEKMSFYLEEAKSIGLTITKPDINTSAIEFKAHKKDIIFGLRGIKNVGLAALENIIAQRTEKKFMEMMDFCTRVDLRTVNKRVLEHLIWAGAFDSLPGNRAQKTAELSSLLETAAEHKRALLTGQMGLFGMQATDSHNIPPYVFQPLPEWADKEKLEKEREVIGFYISSHPLDIYKELYEILKIEAFTVACAKAKEQNTIKDVFVIGVGLLKSKRVINTKKGDKMAFLHLEDYATTLEVIAFPSLFKKIEHWLGHYDIWLVKGTLDSGATQPKLLGTDMVPLELFFQEWKLPYMVTLTCNSLDEKTVLFLKESLVRGKNALKIIFYENNKKLELRTQKSIALDNSLITHFKKQNITVSCLLS